MEGDIQGKSDGGIQIDVQALYTVRLSVFSCSLCFDRRVEIVCREIHKNHLCQMMGFMGSTIISFIALDTALSMNSLKPHRVAHFYCFAVGNINFNADRSTFRGRAQYRFEL